MYPFFAPTARCIAYRLVIPNSVSNESGTLGSGILMTVSQGARVQACTNKMRQELQELAGLGVQMVGNAFSAVLFVKGEPGPAQEAGGQLMSGADGKALRAALLRLGYAPEDWLAMDVSPRASIEPALLRRAICALDPATVVACDEAAAAALRDALADDLSALSSLDDALLVPGRVVQVLGMRVLNLGGFEAALSSDKQKQVMWARLKKIPPLGEPY